MHGLQCRMPISEGKKHSYTIVWHHWCSHWEYLILLASACCRNHQSSSWWTICSSSWAWLTMQKTQKHLHTGGAIQELMSCHRTLWTCKHEDWRSWELVIGGWPRYLFSHSQPDEIMRLWERLVNYMHNIRSETVCKTIYRVGVGMKAWVNRCRCFHWYNIASYFDLVVSAEMVISKNR